MTLPIEHQFIDRATLRVKTENLFKDPIVRLVYNRARESAPRLFGMLTCSRATAVLGFLNYDFSLGRPKKAARNLAEALGIDLSECAAPVAVLSSPRTVFERKIRYWENRSMPDASDAVVSCADAKVLVGSLEQTHSLFIKDKFFSFEELLGEGRAQWVSAFSDGEFAIFRLTPEKYHYNHAPVSGIVRDIYEIDGTFHACNPGAVVAMATPYSKNKRVVTILDTDVPGGTGVGLVAMIEIVAMMIGDIRQCYSETRYDDPQPVFPGMFLKKGQPKSLYRPGSSTDVLLFQPGRVRFCPDIVENMLRNDVSSRFSAGFGRPLVETDLMVRSHVASAA